MLRMMRSVVGVLAACVAAVVGVGVSPTARADLLLDSLPAHPQFYIAVGSTQVVAVRFTSPTLMRLQQVELGLGPADGPVTIDCAIHIDGAVPGAKIRGLTSAGVSGVGTYTVTPVAPLDLAAGQSFWLVVRSASQTGGRWYFSATNATGSFIAQNGLGIWSPGPAGLLPAVRITADPLIVACRNPASGVCALLAPSACQAAAAVGLISVGSTCTPAACHARCAADFNGSGTTTVQDVFDYLSAYFAGCP